MIKRELFNSRLNEQTGAGQRLRRRVALSLVGICLVATSCGKSPEYVEEEVCSPITTVEDHYRALAWGERTIDEAAQGVRGREFTWVQTEAGEDKDEKYIELSIEDGFGLKVGDNYCVKRQVLATTTTQKPALG